MMMETKMTTMDEQIYTLTDNVGEINTTLSNNVRAEMAQSTSSSATKEQNVNLDKKITVDDVSSGTDEITCDVINTETRTEIPTVETNTNDVRARSNVDEGSITVGNDSSNDTGITAVMGKIKTYSAVTHGLKNNPEDDKEETSKDDPW